MAKTVVREIEADIREFLAERVLTRPEVEALTPDSPLIESGLLNSLTLTELVVFLEQRYGVAVTPAEYSMANFQTMRSTCEFMRRKIAARAPGGQ